MRSIINISLPEKTAEKIKKEIKIGGFASTSEFFRHLLREYEEAKLLAKLKLSRAEIKKGRGKTLHSLKDLR